MHEFTREITVPADPREVWNLIGAFDGIYLWHPDVAEPTLAGDPTVLAPADGSELAPTRTWPRS